MAHQVVAAVASLVADRDRLFNEIERLRRQIADRDEDLKRLRAELDATASEVRTLRRYGPSPKGWCDRCVVTSTLQVDKAGRLYCGLCLSYRVKTND